eukprot:7755234-Pyramimonas_sp.AAC.3
MSPRIQEEEEDKEDLQENICPLQSIQSDLPVNSNECISKVKAKIKRSNTMQLYAKKDTKVATLAYLACGLVALHIRHTPAVCTVSRHCTFVTLQQCVRSHGVTHS